MGDQPAEAVSAKRLGTKEWVGLITLTFILGSWTTCYFTIPPATDEIGAAERGTHGDWFGSLNALFSGLAFGGVIYTLLLQHQELKENSKILDASARAQRLQANMMRHAAVLESLPTLLKYSLAQLAHSEAAHLAQRIERWQLSQVEEEISRREDEISPTKTMRDLLLYSPSQFPEQTTQMKSLTEQLAPKEAIIRELKWYLGLRRDLLVHYGAVASIDPEAPFEDRWNH